MKEVEIAMRVIKVRVAREDIEAGIRRSCSSCPLALAICRAMGIGPDLGIVEVAGGDLRLDCFGRTHSIDLGEEAGQFEERFDRGEPVGPFSFHMAIPECWLGPAG